MKKGIFLIVCSLILAVGCGGGGDAAGTSGYIQTTSQEYNPSATDAEVKTPAANPESPGHASKLKPNPTVNSDPKPDAYKVKNKKPHNF